MILTEAELDRISTQTGIDPTDIGIIIDAAIADGCIMALPISLRVDDALRAKTHVFCYQGAHSAHVRLEPTAPRAVCGTPVPGFIAGGPGAITRSMPLCSGCAATLSAVELGKTEYATLIRQVYRPVQPVTGIRPVPRPQPRPQEQPPPPPIPEERRRAPSSTPITPKTPRASTPPDVPKLAPETSLSLF